MGALLFIIAYILFLPLAVINYLVFKNKNGYFKISAIKYIIKRLIRYIIRRIQNIKYKKNIFLIKIILFYIKKKFKKKKKN